MLIGQWRSEDTFSLHETENLPVYHKAAGTRLRVLVPGDPQLRLAANFPWTGSCIKCHSHARSG